MNEAHADPFGLEGTTLCEKYLVGPAVARGGFGVVYRARRLDLDVPVALKVLDGVDQLSGATRDAFLERFRQEARTLAALNHPSIARVIDFGALRRAAGEVPWMALDWIDGGTLEDDLRARAGRGRSPREALDLLRPAFDALACAHEAGVSHRDLKPSNLMLVRARRGETALRVIDFGIAKVARADDEPASGATATASEQTAFSVRYAAPEQVGRTRTGPWTDVHALALLLTEVVTGARAYRSDDGAALLQEIVDPSRPTPGRRGVHVGPWEVVLLRALAVSPGDRPSSAAMLLRELEASVSEAQRAWETSPPPVASAPPLGLAETLPPATQPLLARERADVPASSWRRPALLLALAALTAGVVALALRAVSPTPRAMHRAPVTVVAPEGTTPPARAPSTAVEPAIAAPSPSRVVAAPVRRAARPTAVVRRAAATGATSDVPFVAIE